jgi:hypothetical protein
MENDNSKPKTSRNIPDPIKRAVRQRCGFGCVICGLPLYEYEHMLGWANVQRHVPEEITLLCDRHHREKTNGLLPVQVVKEADANPFNLRRGVSSPYYLHYSGDAVYFQLSNSIIGNPFTQRDDLGNTWSYCTAISIDDVPILQYSRFNQELFLTVQLFDEFNEIALQIQENQLTYKTDSWDIEFTGRRLLLREAQRKILLDISFNAPDLVIVNRGRLLLNGIELLVTPQSFMFGQIKLEHLTIMQELGIAIGAKYGRRQGAAFTFDNISRYKYSTPEIDDLRQEVLRDLEIGK